MRKLLLLGLCAIVLAQYGPIGEFYVGINKFANSELPSEFIVSKSFTFKELKEKDYSLYGLTSADLGDITGVYDEGVQKWVLTRDPEQPDSTDKIRSGTLMVVSSNCAVGDCTAKRGCVEKSSCEAATCGDFNSENECKSMAGCEYSSSKCGEYSQCANIRTQYECLSAVDMSGYECLWKENDGGKCQNKECEEYQTMHECSARKKCSWSNNEFMCKSDPNKTRDEPDGDDTDDGNVQANPHIIKSYICSFANARTIVCYGDVSSVYVQLATKVDGAAGLKVAIATIILSLFALLF